jgi:hypothetical protein
MFSEPTELVEERWASQPALRWLSCWQLRHARPRRHHSGPLTRAIVIVIIIVVIIIIIVTTTTIIIIITIAIVSIIITDRMHVCVGGGGCCRWLQRRVDGGPQAAAGWGWSAGRHR